MVEFGLVMYMTEKIKSREYVLELTRVAVGLGVARQIQVKNSFDLLTVTVVAV